MIADWSHSLTPCRVCRHARANHRIRDCKQTEGKTCPDRQTDRQRKHGHFLLGNRDVMIGTAGTARVLLVGPRACGHARSLLVIVAVLRRLAKNEEPSAVKEAIYQLVPERRRERSLAPAARHTSSGHCRSWLPVTDESERASERQGEHGWRQVCSCLTGPTLAKTARLWTEREAGKNSRAPRRNLLEGR